MDLMVPLNCLSEGSSLMLYESASQSPSFIRESCVCRDLRCRRVLLHIAVVVVVVESPQAPEDDSQQL